MNLITLNGKWNLRSKCSGERGQTMVFFVLGLGIVFLAVLGFAIDFGNLWFHRQRAQTAADAACTAAVMDMLYNVQASPTTPAGGFTTGTNFTCAGSPTSAPCHYASLNGYNGTGLVANTESNSVEFTFPGSVTGIPPVTFPLEPGVLYSGSAFIQTKVTDRIHTSFFGLVSSVRTMDVPAKATCGLLLTTSPIPLLILDPTRPSTMTLDGGAGLKIWGGPPVSIQVNSSNAGAVVKNGSNGQVDLSLGGPIAQGSTQPTGSAMHVDAIQTTTLSTSNTSGCVAPPGGPDLCLGTTGSYGTHTPIPDPLATIAAPEQPTWTGSGQMTNGQVTNNISADVDVAPANRTGCPAPTTKKCSLYAPGYYAGNTTVSGYAIFAPGIYYFDGSVTFGPNSCIRPATVTGDGSGGTFFYFAGAGSINVGSNSGCNNGNPQTVASNFQTKTGTGSYLFGAACDSTSLASLPSNIPDTIAGSVLLAPCRAPTDTTLCAPNCTKNGGTAYGDPLGPTDPSGLQRGILFMQNRNTTLASSAMPTWIGGGSFLLSGTMYFHQCRTSGGADSGGSGCTTAAFTDLLELGGNASGTSYVLGDIIIDQLKIHGTPNLYMDLSPNEQFLIYKASLLQ